MVNSEYLLNVYKVIETDIRKDQKYGIYIGAPTERVGVKTCNAVLEYQIYDAPYERF